MLERHWSGGVDRNENQSVDVFLDGSLIQYGVCNGDAKVIDNLTEQEAKEMVTRLKTYTEQDTIVIAAYSPQGREAALIVTLPETQKIINMLEEALRKARLWAANS